MGTELYKLSMKSIIMQIGKERNMTFPKVIANRLGISPVALENAQGVFLIERLVTSEGKIISEEEIDNKLRNKMENKT